MLWNNAHLSKHERYFSMYVCIVWIHNINQCRFLLPQKIGPDTKGYTSRHYNNDQWTYCTWSWFWSGRRPEWTRARGISGGRGAREHRWCSQFRMHLFRHVLSPVFFGYSEQPHHHLGLLLRVLENDIVLRVGRGMANDSRAEYLGQAVDRHLVGIAVLGHFLQVEDEEGQSVLVGGRQLCQCL